MMVTTWLEGHCAFIDNFDSPRVLSHLTLITISNVDYGDISAILQPHAAL